MGVECTSLLKGCNSPDADVPSCFIQSGSAVLHTYNTASLGPGLGLVSGADSRHDNNTVLTAATETELYFSFIPRNSPSAVIVSTQKNGETSINKRKRKAVFFLCVFFFLKLSQMTSSVVPTHISRQLCWLLCIYFWPQFYLAGDDQMFKPKNG